MITIKPAKQERRARDVRRRRYVLRIGELVFHLDKNEAIELKRQLKVLLQGVR